mmetsp:Transcript_246/g.666  ORF Transcript_246/g.666 Transcript_246/m.666 type:complete len:97 (+) Transcript_246:187-477(+)
MSSQCNLSSQRTARNERKSIFLYSVICPCDQCGERIKDFKVEHPSLQFTLVFERKWKPSLYERFSGYSDATVLRELESVGIRVLNVTEVLERMHKV